MVIHIELEICENLGTKSMKSKYKIRYYDFKLILFLVALTIIGIMAIGSASPADRDKQFAGFILGFFLMVIISVFDYGFFLKFYWVFYGLNMILLIAVQLFGNSAGGAQRWISVLGVSFQPSETAKILLILFFSEFIMKHREKLNSPKILMAMILLMLPPWLLIYEQPDLSTSIMMLIVFATLIFIGGISYKYIIGFFAIAVPAVVIFLTIVLQEGQTLIKDYQRTRILAWLHPEDYINAEGYQQSNSIMAIGSGMLWGKGLNNNEITSVKNGNFISEPETDFIFAVVGEEMGFVGSCVVILLLELITIECVLIGRRAKDLAGRLICSGMAILVSFQGFMNISVATGLLPNTGIPLPFVSAGLTSLVALYIGMGFVLNIGLQGVRKKNTNREG